jgi:cytochrome c biogenesis protein CcdA
MTVLAYTLYLVIAISMTIWVAYTLSTNGKVYLIRCFGHDAELATSINHLLVVGFYLVNFGFIALALSTAGAVKTTEEAMRFLGWYVGIATLVLGAMHFFNMGAVTRHGRKVADWVHERVPEPTPEPVTQARTPATTKRDSILR